MIGPIAECRRAMFFSLPFFNRRQVESLAQGADEGLIVADGFPRAVGEFRHRLAVTFHQLNHDIERFNLRQIAG